MRLVDWLLLIILSVLWGGSFFFVEVALTSLPPLTLIFFRLSIGAFVINFIRLFCREPLPREPSIWGSLFLLGLLNNALPFSLIVWAQTMITGGVASILNATAPFFGVLVTHFLTADEKITTGKLLGVTIGFSGVALLIGFDPPGSEGSRLIGKLAVLAGALCYSFAGILAKKILRSGIKPNAMATGQLLCSFPVVLIGALLIDSPWSLPLPTWGAVAAVVGLGSLSTAFAYVLYFRIMSSSGVTNALLVTFLIPISALLLGTIFLGEEITARHLLGMGVIGVGLLVVDGRLTGRLWVDRG